MPPTTVGFNPTDDGYTNQGAPNSHFGNGVYLIAGVDKNDFTGGPQGLCRSFVKFNITSVPTGKVIVNAKLKTFSFYSGGDGSYGDYYLYIQTTATTWNRFTLTHNTQPSASPAISAQVLIPLGQLNGEIDFDVTADVAAAYAGTGIISFRIATDQDVDGGVPSEFSNLSATNYANGFSVLEITYADPSTRKRSTVVFND